MILLPSSRARLATVPFLFRAHACMDDIGLYALSYGQKVYATFGRAYPAWQEDQEGRWHTVPSHRPRLTSALVGGARRPALLLEDARTNLLLHSGDFSQAAWTKTNVSIVSNSVRGPDDAFSADEIVATAAGAALCYQAVTASSTRMVFSAIVRQGSGATDANRFAFFNQSTGLNLAVGTLNYSSGAFTVSVGNGRATALTGLFAGWYLVELWATTGITVGNLVRGYPCFDGASEGAGEWAACWHTQIETGVVATSPVVTGASTATRAADEVSFPLRMRPQALSVYYAGIELGIREQAQAEANSYHLWTLTNAATANPKLRMNCFSGSGRHQFQHTFADGSHSTSSVNSDAVQPSIGEAFETRGILAADGSVVASMQAASESSESIASAGVTGPLASAWGGELLYFNQQGSAGAQRFRSAVRGFAIAPGVRSMADLRDLCELG